MKKFHKRTTGLITKIATLTANKASGCASGWMIYQPKEPQKNKISK